MINFSHVWAVNFVKSLVCSVIFERFDSPNPLGPNKFG